MDSIKNIYEAYFNNNNNNNNNNDNNNDNKKAVKKAVEYESNDCANCDWCVRHSN